MASMNNWLGFSLSPQPQDHSHASAVSRLGFNSEEISGADVSGECFDLASDSTVPSLNLPAPFGIFEAFNRNNQSQDWNMKGVNMNSSSNYKASSELSMLMGSSCSNQNLEDHGPKLENFLGGHSFADHRQKLSDQMYPNCSLQLPSETNMDNGGGGSTSTIGLSMIKNWLRNQQSSPAPPDNKGAQSTLSLSMSTGSQTTTPLPLLSAGGGGGGESSTSSDNRQLKETTADAQTGAVETVPRKSIDTFGQRTSIYRGVTRHRWTGRYEAHLWDNSCRREGQTRKGRQVYLGGYDKEEKAARAYDLAALKYWGPTTTTNFPVSNYEKEIEEMKHMTRQEYVASLRRKSSGFSRGASIYRGVTRHHQHGRWQARIGRVAGNKDLYLGTFSTQEEAAEAYDIAAIKFRGLNAVTNFDMSRYDVKSILESSTLPIGGAAKRLKDVEQAEMAMEAVQRADADNISSHLGSGMGGYGANWPTIAFQQAQPLNFHYPYGRLWCKQEPAETEHAAFGQDLNQLQLGNPHNFFQLQNLMSMESSSSIEHSSGSSNPIYGGVGFPGAGGNGNGGYVMPLGTTVISQEAAGNNTHGSGFGENNEIKELGYENMFGSSDPRNSHMYYLSQQQQSACNDWIPTAVPALSQRAGAIAAVCNGSQTFTVWNDT
ncbi:AP2-like ethylene-responsive transcription factor BBM [Diospyros lotus]|uniref:AP2-like ethylene-responsive transcription factor BBM n=1 Tax=Diospyros lotus TaxID=55363 RepID=UPI0022577FD2|nr:AP2-like ethylene-responsive transcription factor BBM [Diospyros lotus]